MTTGTASLDRSNLRGASAAFSDVGSQLSDSDTGEAVGVAEVEDVSGSASDKGLVADGEVASMGAA